MSRFIFANRDQRHRARSGRLVVIAIFLFGGILLALLFAAPRARQPASFRVVSYNIYHNYNGRERIVADLAQLKPDLACVQEIEAVDVEPMARALGMEATFRQHWPSGAPRTDGASETEGIAIFSKMPVTNVRELSTSDGRVFGVWGEANIGGAKRCAIASVHLIAIRGIGHLFSADRRRRAEIDEALATWHREASPPLILAGDFNQLPSGDNYRALTANLRDALDALHKTQPTCKHGLLNTRIDYIFISPQWQLNSGDVGAAGASDHRPIWIDVRR